MIKLHDLVIVTDSGESYTTYTDLFTHLRDNNSFGNGLIYAHGSLPVEGETYIVASIGEHLNRGWDKIALIHNDNHRAYLIDVEGLELK